MKIFTIYRATNNINGKIYIGYDSAWPRRMKSHLTATRSERKAQYKQHFHDAIRKHGEINFTWDVLYQSLDGDHTLNIMEEHFIREYRTCTAFNDCNGYNLTVGGEGQKHRPVSAETRAKKSAALFNKPTALSREVSTPYGIFPGLYFAARGLNLNPNTVMHRIKQGSFPEWFYVDQQSIIQTVNIRLGKSLEIFTPYGLFDSYAACSKATELPLSTVADRVNNPNFIDWYHTGVMSKRGTRSVTTPNGRFESIRDAARFHNLSTYNISSKIRSKHKTEWNYTD